MAYQCQIKGLQSIALLNMFAVISFYSQGTEGNLFEVLEEPSGEIQSPGYPDLDDDMNCTWKVIAPENHRITLTFLDFDLVERPICTDEVEIHSENVEEGPYIGSQLQSQTITSTGNTTSVVLRSCGASLFSDRRGIRVSYLTVYPTTLSYSTSKITTTKLTSSIPATSSKRTSTTTFYKDIKSTLSSVFASTPPILSSIEYTSSGNSTGKGSLYTIIGAVLTVLFVLMIISVLLILKRRDARSPASDPTTHAGNSENNQENGYFTTVATERASVKSLGNDYEEVNETQKDMSGVYYSRGIVSTNWGSSRLQNKHSNYDTGKNVGEGLYENYSSKHKKTVDDQDYNHAI